MDTSLPTNAILGATIANPTLNTGLALPDTSPSVCAIAGTTVANETIAASNTIIIPIHFFFICFLLFFIMLIWVNELCFLRQ
jgi:hypothetical protein